MACLLAAAVALARAQIPAATLTQANTYLQAGEAERRLRLLTPLPTSGTGRGRAQNLLAGCDSRCSSGAGRN